MRLTLKSTYAKQLEKHLIRKSIEHKFWCTTQPLSDLGHAGDFSQIILVSPVQVALKKKEGRF